MTHEEKLKAVRDKVISAVPEIGYKITGKKERFVPFIRLADVLLAIEEWYWKNPMANVAGHEWYIVELIHHYKLSDNSLAKQSPETIDFLHEILNK